MTRDLKFGYGFSSAGVRLPYLIDKAFGTIPALIVSAILTLLGVVFLIAGHLHKDREEPRATRRGYIASTIVATLAIGVVAWFAVRTFRHVAPDTPARSDKASIFFGEGPNASGSEIAMKLFETGGYDLTATAGDSAVATLKMKPNGHISLDVNVVDEKANSIIRIHDNEFTVVSNLDRNSNENAYEAINADGQVVFQLKRKAPVEIVINGVFKMKSGVFFLAGPKGALQTKNVRYDYTPKPLFKYPSWRFPGQYADTTDWSAFGVLFTICVIVLAVAFVIVSRGSRSRGVRLHAGLEIQATGTVQRLVATSDGPQVLLDYEWHDDGADRHADRKDRPIYVRNSSEDDAMRVQIKQMEHRKVKATFDLIPHVSKGNPPLEIKPTIEYDGHSFSQIRNTFSLIFLQSDSSDEAIIQLPIYVAYSDIRGRDYSTHYSLKYDRAKGQAIATFERWGRLVEVRDPPLPQRFLRRCQGFVLKILGREQS